MKVTKCSVSSDFALVLFVLTQRSCATSQSIEGLFFFGDGARSLFCI